LAQNKAKATKNKMLENNTPVMPPQPTGLSDASLPVSPHPQPGATISPAPGVVPVDLSKPDTSTPNPMLHEIAGLKPHGTLVQPHAGDEPPEKPKLPDTDGAAAAKEFADSLNAQKVRKAAEIIAGRVKEKGRLESMDVKDALKLNLAHDLKHVADDLEKLESFDSTSDAFSH
jgi:hypothetical protein